MEKQKHQRPTPQIQNTWTSKERSKGKESCCLTFQKNHPAASVPVLHFRPLKASRQGNTHEPRETEDEGRMAK
ncbi:hypothetical protein A2U01_0052999 [Trifolium medium]|uniref:Uncharacterized protein n=1 Tax=Trifolium medium TaxID=97028 RepID=A0A392R6C7_9FABA|nr:hypothetical protein [Trifolium medium]